jgi:hypothetical protein
MLRFWVILCLAGCESFSATLWHKLRIPTVSAKMQRTQAQTWAPTVPTRVDLSQGAQLVEQGVQKCAFENFFAKLDKSSYSGYKWELINNTVFIYDMTDTPHEKAVGAFDGAFRDVAVQGGWLRDIVNIRSARLINPDNPGDSNWEPDCSFVPNTRRGRVGSNDKLLPYPMLVVEVATSETNDHVISKAQKSWTQYRHSDCCCVPDPA